MPLLQPPGMMLTPTERRWVGALLEALLPAGADPRLPLGARDVEMVGRLEAMLAANPPHAAWGTRMAVALLQVLPPFLTGDLAMFRALPPRKREEVLKRCAESPVYVLREVFALVKTMALMVYFDDPRTVEALRRSV